MYEIKATHYYHVKYGFYKINKFLTCLKLPNFAASNYYAHRIN